jgi:hypothetical protein
LFATLDCVTPEHPINARRIVTSSALLAFAKPFVLILSLPLLFRDSSFTDASGDAADAFLDQRRLN